MTQDTVRSVPVKKAGPNCDVSFMPMAFGGHCYYVRKLITGKQIGPDLMRDRTVGGIYITDEMADSPTYDTALAEVIGIGPNVGKPCTRAHRELYCPDSGPEFKGKRARCLPADVEVGDIVLCKTPGKGIRQSPLECGVASPCEYFVEESWVLAKVEFEDKDF